MVEDLRGGRLLPARSAHLFTWCTRSTKDFTPVCVEKYQFQVFLLNTDATNDFWFIILPALPLPPPSYLCSYFFFNAKHLWQWWMQESVCRYCCIKSLLLTGLQTTSQICRCYLKMRIWHATPLLALILKAPARRESLFLVQKVLKAMFLRQAKVNLVPQVMHLYLQTPNSTNTGARRFASGRTKVRIYGSADLPRL